MWTREELKTRAKEILSNSYWKAFLVSLVLVISLGKSNSGNGSNSNGSRSFITMEELLFMLTLLGGLLLFRVFLGYMLEVGSRKYFISAALGDVKIGYIGYIFRSSRYVAVLSSMLIRGILLVLWTLLLIIPGIIKSYAYRMVPYILADNPNIGAKRAIELSNEMTYGHKWNIFVLDLSFLGWFLLGALACGVGTFFVLPYYNSTDAELYLALKEAAINSGLGSHEELSTNDVL